MQSHRLSALFRFSGSYKSWRSVRISSLMRKECSYSLGIHIKIVDTRLAVYEEIKQKHTMRLLISGCWPSEYLFNCETSQSWVVGKNLLVVMFGRSLYWHWVPKSHYFAVINNFSKIYSPRCQRSTGLMAFKVSLNGDDSRTKGAPNANLTYEANTSLLMTI